jgi:hypothetical protein
MNGLTLLFAVESVLGIAILLWFRTKSGKKWLEEL